MFGYFFSWNISLKKMAFWNWIEKKVKIRDCLLTNLAKTVGFRNAIKTGISSCCVKICTWNFSYRFPVGLDSYSIYITPSLFLVSFSLVSLYSFTSIVTVGNICPTNRISYVAVIEIGDVCKRPVHRTSTSSGETGWAERKPIMWEVCPTVLVSAQLISGADEISPGFDAVNAETWKREDG